MIVNGWRLFQYKLFTAELDSLLAEVKKLQESQPDTFKEHQKTKRLVRIYDLMTKEIPEDPGHERFQQGNTLGPEFRLWKRAKFGKDRRYRLFFRYDGTKKVIIYAWVSNEKTIRKDGDKNDAYTVFAKGLKAGNPPADLDALLKLCTESEPLAIQNQPAESTQGKQVDG